jgi:hypothetical protein
MAERRPAGLTRRPDFGTAQDRLLGLTSSEPETPQTAQGAPGASGASALEKTQPPARRRPLKVAGPIADELHNAVLFLRGRGRPELTQNELIDELLTDGLQRVKADLNEGQPFPLSGRRGHAKTL